MDIIPAIDLLGGRCVRLYQGDFARVTQYGADPLELAARYRAAGATRLHVVDLDGARTGAPANREIIVRLAAESGLAVQVGGGVRDQPALEALLAAGADRVVIGSTAVNTPDTAIAWLRAVGSERLVLAFDVRPDPATAAPVVLTHGWQESSGQNLWELTARYLDAGARHILCTDVSRDGTGRGPNTDLYASCVERFPQLSWLASGGLSSAADLAPLAATGVAGVVTGKALLDGRLALEEVRLSSRAG